MDWEAREFKLDSGAGARVFACEVLLMPSGRSSRRWLSVDGVLLNDGRVMLNKEDALQQAALHAGLDAQALTGGVKQWIANNIHPQAALAAAAGAE